MFLLAAFLALSMIYCTNASTGIRSRSDNVQTSEIRGPTNWGDWQPMDFCPEGMWAVGTRLRAEGSQGKNDDTALNSVKLLCAPLGEFGTAFQEAESYPGLWGNWRDPKFCPQSLVTGYDLRVEGRQGNGDDTAANNVKMMCSNRQVLEMNGEGWGDYIGMKTCPTGSAVCGVQIQFEKSQGKDDDTAMNNMNVACCKVSLKGACDHPSDSWVTVVDCDNTRSDSPTECTYDRFVGVTSSKSSSTTNSVSTEKSLSVMAEVGADFEGLSAKFSTAIGTSTRTGHDWTNSKSETFQKSISTTVKMMVPPGKRKRVEQVVGQCNDVSAYTPVFRTSDVA